MFVLFILSRNIAAVRCLHFFGVHGMSKNVHKSALCLFVALATFDQMPTQAFDSSQSNLRSKFLEDSYVSSRRHNFKTYE